MAPVPRHLKSRVAVPWVGTHMNKRLQVGKTCSSDTCGDGSDTTRESNGCVSIEPVNSLNLWLADGSLMNMAKSLRARKNKVQKSLLRSAIFQPVQTARNERLFKKILEAHGSADPAHDVKQSIAQEGGTSKWIPIPPSYEMLSPRLHSTQRAVSGAASSEDYQSYRNR